MSGKFDATESPTPDPMGWCPIAAGDVVANKYAVEGKLGFGGMGLVFAARDTALERRVAIKVLRPRLLAVPTASERFMREARAATRITSEHGVRVLEVGTLPDGLPFFVMEHLEGSDLGTLLAERGAFPLKQAVDYLLQALQAIAEAHSKGIVHRDIKPSNLFLTQHVDGTPLIKVLDFGIAKTLTDDSPNLGALTGSEDTRLGSPLYMSPEQLRDPRSVDFRADIWGIGVTLYELLTGTTPFGSSNQFETVSKILNETPDPLAKKRPGLEVPPEVEQVVFTCLAREREERFANVVDLATQLAPFGSDDAAFSLGRIGRLASRTTPVSLVPRADPALQSLVCPETVPVEPQRFETVSNFGRSRNRSGARISRSAVGIALVTGVLVAAVAAVVTTREPRSNPSVFVSGTSGVGQPGPSSASSASSPSSASSAEGAAVGAAGILRGEAADGSPLVIAAPLMRGSVNESLVPSAPSAHGSGPAPRPKRALTMPMPSAAGDVSVSASPIPVPSQPVYANDVEALIETRR